MEQLVYAESRYLTNPNEPSSLLNILGNELYRLITIRVEGAVKAFKSFASLSDYEEYFVATKPDNRCFHEVIHGNLPQRIKFDIDAPAERIASHSDADKIALKVANTIISTFNERYEEELNKHYKPTFKHNILITESHSTTKYSYHIILTDFKLANYLECKAFTEVVCDKLPVNIAGNGDIQGIIDRQVDRATSNLRILGCTKKGESRYKRISKLCHSTDNGLIQANSKDYVISTKYVKRGAMANASSTTIPEDAATRTIELIKDLFPEFSYRNTNDNFMSFDRLRPSLCNICDQIHDKDNTLLVYRAGDAIYYKCRHDMGQPSTNIKLLDIETPEYNRDEALKTMVENYTDLENIIDPFKGVNMRPSKGAKGSIVEYNEPKVKSMDDSPTEFVRAPMKLGKTKTLKQFIDRQDVNLTVCILSFRLTFTHELKRKLNGFDIYTEIKGDISPDIHPRVIIQVESLHRVCGHYDIVVLDESESILSQFQSGNVRSLSMAFAKFESIIRNSMKTICMDAFMGERTVEVINKIRKKPFKITYNKHQNAKDYTYNLCHYRGNDYFYNEIREALRHGENIAIMANKRSDLEAIHELIKINFPGIDTEIYTSVTNMKTKKEHMENVNEHWKGKRVVLYTPTITAGISFEEEWFDQIFAIFTNHSCDVLSCMQMLGRIRNVRKKTITIAFDVKPTHCSTSINAIKRDIINGRVEMLSMGNGSLSNVKLTVSDDGMQYGIDDTDNYYWLWIYNEQATNISKKKFIQHMCTLITETGASINVHTSVGNNANGKILNCIKKEQRKEQAIVIAQTPMPTDTEISKIHDKTEENIDLTETERHQYTKYGLKKIYCLYNVSVLNDPDFIYDYNVTSTKRIYRNLTYILSDKDVDKALENIRRLDLREFEAVKDDRVRRMEFVDRYPKHKGTIDLIKMSGFKQLLTDEHVIATTMSKNIQKNVQKINKIIMTHHNKYAPRMVASDTEYAEHIKTMTNIIAEMYGFRLYKDYNADEEVEIYILKRPKKIRIVEIDEDMDSTDSNDDIGDQTDNEDIRPTIYIKE